MQGESATTHEGEETVPRQGWRLYQLLRLTFRWLRWWMRLEGDGIENLPLRGPVLVISNHDSWLDPLALVEVMMWRARPVRFLAKSTLWKWRPIAAILDGISQIPVQRGIGDHAAMEAAIAALDRGEAVGIFPEGTLSRGERLRARRGAARLALACPEVPVLLATVEGGNDVLRFPRRPRMKIVFFKPAGGQARPDEDPAELAERFMEEIRLRVPPI